MGSKLEVIDISGETSEFCPSRSTLTSRDGFGVHTAKPLQRVGMLKQVGTRNRNKFHSKVSVLSGRYFKLTDKENENKERKTSEVGISAQFTRFP